MGAKIKSIDTTYLIVVNRFTTYLIVGTTPNLKYMRTWHKVAPILESDKSARVMHHSERKNMPCTNTAVVQWLKVIVLFPKVVGSNCAGYGGGCLCNLPDVSGNNISGLCFTSRLVAKLEKKERKNMPC